MRAWLRRQWLAAAAALFGLDLGYETRKARERTLQAVAWRLPRGLVFWCAVRVIAHATTGRHGETLVPQLTAIEALERWRLDQGRP
jgi:hypothetical protein